MAGIKACFLGDGAELSAAALPSPASRAQARATVCTEAADSDLQPGHSCAVVTVNVPRGSGFVSDGGQGTMA